FVRGLLPPGLGGGGTPRGGAGGGMLGGGRGVLLIVLAVLAAWLAWGFYRVQPDEVGVVLRFGRFDRIALPGLNYHLPWPIESFALPAVTRINRVEVGFRSGSSDISPQRGREAAAGEVPQESLMLTGDENIIDINLVVFWRIRD